MDFSPKFKLSRVFSSFVFIGLLYCSITVLPAVEGQYETANDQCGGIFRSIKGSIKFKYNATAGTHIEGEKNKTCVWTIIPNPMYHKFQVNIKWNLNCSGNTGNDILAITTFEENSDAIESSSNYCKQEDLTLNGQVMVVTLVTRNPVDGPGFNMTWDRVEGDSFLTPGLRMVTAFNSYGRTSNEPIPYWTAHFMGNSLSTFAFPKGNNTEGYSLQMTFTEVELEGRICGTKPKGCDILKICGIEADGRITARRTFKGENYTLSQPEVIRNKFGFFFIMWGGNPTGASGGGSVTLEYSTLRD